MASKIELAVFDIAGTTLRDNGEITLAFQASLCKHGYHVPSWEINPLMGYNKPEAIKTILHKYEQDDTKITGSLIEEIHNRFMALISRYYATSEKVQPLPHTEFVFSYLKNRNIKIGLDTGFSKNITDVIMERTGWLQRGFVDYVVSSNEVEAGRPHPFMIQKMMQWAGITDAGRVIKIGDTEVDVNEGKNAGCLYSIAVTTGAFNRDELEPYNPSFIIDDLWELIPIIENA